MSEQEKILLIELILNDIRLNWADSVSSRVETAYRLCGEISTRSDDFLHLGEVIREWDHSDGRYFRDTFPEGYEDMSNLHNLDYRLNDKSDEFKRVVDSVLTYPEYLFEDVR